jgi:Fic family protein
MPELPIHPARGREAPGYALERRLSRLRDASAIGSDVIFYLSVECAFETLRLTGAGVERELVRRLAEERREREPEGRRREGGALVLGQLDALDAIDGAATRGKPLDEALVREVHRMANPPSQGEFRATELTPRFSNARLSPPRFIAARLQNLLDWISAASAREMFPAERMALWLPRFIEISPFERGNFRTAHLLSSYFARAAGFPPVSFRFQEAEEVRSELEKAFLFDTFPLVKRFSGALDRALAFLEERAERES